MPPTAASRSRTVTGTPRSDRRHAAEIPAGPAPRTTTRGWSDTLGDHEVIQVHREWKGAERKMKRFGDAETVRQPAPHFSGRRERQVIGIPDRKLSQQEPAGAHRRVVRHDHQHTAAGFQDAPGFGEYAPRLTRVLEHGNEQHDFERL